MRLFVIIISTSVDCCVSLVNVFRQYVNRGQYICAIIEMVLGENLTRLKLHSEQRSTISKFKYVFITIANKVVELLIEYSRVSVEKQTGINLLPSFKVSI